jgi:hypothetical protein
MIKNNVIIIPIIIPPKALDALRGYSSLLIKYKYIQYGIKIDLYKIVLLFAS